jgi:hypothetical protein
MNKKKIVSGIFVIGIGLIGSISAYGAKPDNLKASPSNTFFSRAVEIPQADPVISGLPCQYARRWPKMTTYTDCETPANKTGNPSENAKTFLKDHSRSLSLLQDLSDLKETNVKEGLNKKVTRFQQTFNNLPVLNAFVSIHQSATGRVSKINSSYINNPLISGATIPLIDKVSAEKIALEGIRQLSGISTLKIIGNARSELNWSSVSDRKLTLIWIVKTRTLKPRGYFYTLVDANTGKRLLQENRIVFATGTGMVYKPNPVQTSDIINLIDNDDQTDLVFEQQRVEVLLQGLDVGTNLLKGEFVDTASFKASTCPRLNALCSDADDVNRTYLYTRNQAEFEQVVIYNAIDSLQHYLRDSLGFQDILGNATIRNFPTMAISHATDLDQSFYEPDVYEDPTTFELRGVLNFGDGGVDDAEDADIIVHEFGHAIQNNQNPGCFPGGDYVSQVNETRAIGEGFGDYLAASFYKNQGNSIYQSTDAPCVGDWDSTSYSTTTPACLRRVDGGKHYPEDLDPSNPADSHKDGEIWSATLWDLHADLNSANPTQGGLGASRADQLIIDSHFTLDCSNGITMAQTALVMIDSTTDLNEKNIIRTKFCNRGILIGNSCLSEVNKSILVNVQKDSTLLMGAPNRNEGASPNLSLLSVSEKEQKVKSIVVGFDLSKIMPATIASARLVMTVQKNTAEWGSKGRTVAVFPLKSASFEEGNGTLKKQGSGRGITWSCNIDTNISNNEKDCNKKWNGGDVNLRSASSFVHTNSLKTGDEVTWDVTDDVKNGTMAWLVKKGNRNIGDDEIVNGRTQGEKNENHNRGEIVYFAKESSIANAPRLEVTLK